MNEDGFYVWLRKQFADRLEACDWVHRFVSEMNQKTPFGGFTWRAMAFHVSLVLEGAKSPESSSSSLTNYLQTKYGEALYQAMSDPDFGKQIMRGIPE